MASITVISGWHCVGAILVFRVGHLVEANLMIKLSASIRVPNFIPCMIESKLCHWQMRNNVLGMNHSVIFSTWVESHDMV